MEYGYSTRLVALNKKADIRSVGVRLGRVCMKRGISVSEVAAELHVTRQTVYNWFCGAHQPRPAVYPRIVHYLHTIDPTR